MPIYAYRCRVCGESFEKLILSARKADEVVCPACESEEVERTPSLFGIGGIDRGTAAANCSTPVGGG